MLNVLAAMKIQLVVFFAVIIGNVSAQENCTFSSQNKKGGHYLFSTFYSDYAETPMEGVCQQLDQKGKIYERRVFVVGRMKEEILYYYEGGLRSEFRITQLPGDSVIGFQKTYTEAGKLQTHYIFYLNKKKRRCAFYREYYPNGNLRFQRNYCWAKLDDIDPSAYKDHPPHTIDEDGYTYLMTEFGESLTFYENGQVSERKVYRMEFSSNYYDYAMDGPYYQYFDNGKVMTKGYFHEGTKDGTWKRYYYTGELSETEHYKENLPVGTWAGYYANGDQKHLKIYDPNSNHVFVPSETYWNEKNIKVRERILDISGSGLNRVWSESGVLLEETEWIQNSEIRGIKKKWYPSGQEQSILDNRPNATSRYIEYHENGVLAKLHEHQVNKDTVVDTRQEWSQSNQLLLRIISKQSAKFNDYTLASFSPQGIPIQYISQINQQRKEKHYATNGVLVKEFSLLNGELNGAYTIHDSTGKIIHSFNYLNNLRHGICESYENGKLIFRQGYNMGCVDPTITNRKNYYPALSTWTKEQSDRYRNIVYTILNRNAYSGSSPFYYSKPSIDSMTQRIAWFEKAWKSTTPLELSESGASANKIDFTLPAHVFKGAEKCDTVNHYVKQLYNVFKKLNWPWPTDLMVKDNMYSFSYKDDKFYPVSTYYTHFQWFIQSGYASVPSPETEIEIDDKFYRSRTTFSLARLNSCVFLASYSYHGANFQWLIYDDGSVEFYGQRSNWEDIGRVTLGPDYIHEMPYD